MISNQKAYKFITGSGFNEINRNINDNRIDFIISYKDFINKNKKFNFIF